LSGHGRQLIVHEGLQPLPRAGETDSEPSQESDVIWPVDRVGDTERPGQGAERGLVGAEGRRGIASTALFAYNALFDSADPNQLKTPAARA